MRKIPHLYILIFIFINISLISTQDYNYDDYNNYNFYEDYVDSYRDYVDSYRDGCAWTEMEHFCPSTDTCKNASEACDGQCGRHHHFCPSKSVCLHDSEACDGQCTEEYRDHIFRVCPSTGTCIDEYTACDGMCPDNRPNVCDNETFCYPNHNFNDHYYDCKDKSDEQWSTGDPEPCKGFYRFCPSNGLCLNKSEDCDGQCTPGYHFSNYSNSCIYCTYPDHFCITTDSCLLESEACDGECKEGNYLCSSTNSCIDEFTACDGNCPDDRPNICDGTYCYDNNIINNREYDCIDRSDEHRPKEQLPSSYAPDISSLTKFLKLNTTVGNIYIGFPGMDCQDGTEHPNFMWCREEDSRMCGGVSTTDYFICHNSSLWRDRLCGNGMVRGCKVPGKCVSVHSGRFKCDEEVGNDLLNCGISDYSYKRCPVNEGDLEEYKKYFRCKDNSSLIHPTLVCDGYKHCDDLSDENACNICPRVNNMVVHSQVVKLMDEEIRDFPHLKNTAIMKCQSPYGQHVCATPGDGIAECAWELNEGQWQTQDEVELTSATLWRTIFKYMSYIFLMSVVVLFKIIQMGYLCQKPTDDVPMRPFSESSFPSPFLNTTQPMKLTQKFKQYYIQTHRSGHSREFFNFCLTLAKFFPTWMERDIFYCGIYSLEAQIHGMSPTCTDRCLKQHSSAALESMFDAVYGSFSDRFPTKVNNVLFIKDKIMWLNYVWRIKIFLVRYFFFYYDIVQEYVLLSFILGAAGLGISTSFWLDISDFHYVHIMIYIYVSSVFLPLILFAIQLAFSCQIGIIFGIKNPSIGQKIFFGCCCFILFPFIPTVLFFKMENKQMKKFNCATNAGKALDRLIIDNIANNDFIYLKRDIVNEIRVLNDLNSEVIEAKYLYKKLKAWELAIEMPIQMSLITIFSFMKKSTTVVNQVFQKWFISDTKSLILLIGMSLRSIIAVQISDESGRRNDFLGMKSKMLLTPLYMMSSIPRIASIVIYAAVPLGLMDLLGHWTAEKQGNGYSWNTVNTDYFNVSHLKECLADSGYNLTKKGGYYRSNVFSADVSSTKYTAWPTPIYAVILMALLETSVIINFLWLYFRSQKSLSEKILSSTKSVLCITVESDFDEDDQNFRPDQLQNHYRKKFDMVQTEYILKLLLHTGTNMVLTFPWALAYQAAKERHQLLMEIGDCLGMKGTVEMEDISLERLWWGQWVLPLVMAALGVLNYGWYRLYVKYGHPWRRLLISDDERIEEWKTLKLWEILDNQNDN